MTCPTCEGLRFVPCPRAGLKSVCARSCETCHGNHVVPCPDCESRQEHDEVQASAEAEAVIAEMHDALKPLITPEPLPDLPQYVAVDRVVMQGQVLVCRAPSHQKAKKLARILNRGQAREFAETEVTE